MAGTISRIRMMPRGLEGKSLGSGLTQNRCTHSWRSQMQKVSGDLKARSTASRLGNKKLGGNRGPVNPPQRLHFANALAAEMKKHRDTHLSLLDAVQIAEEPHARLIFKKWMTAKSIPRWKESFDLLNRVEARYGLHKDYFKDLLIPQLPSETAINRVSANQKHLVRWHLPIDFDRRSEAQQRQIVEWIEQNVLAGATDFGRYLSRTNEKRFRLRFAQLGDVTIRAKRIARFSENAGFLEYPTADASIGQNEETPQQLVVELDDLVRFKRSTISLPGFHRHKAWSKYTVELRTGSYGRIFGAMMAAPRSQVAGLGVPKSHITMALMAFSSVWDWFLGWAEKRRGFYTKYEFNVLVDVISLIRTKTGWLWQHPELAIKLRPIPGLISRADIRKAKKNWHATCEDTVAHLRARSREISRIMRTHRDPFEPILPVLSSASPLREYRKITVEILKRMPREDLYPGEAAEFVRNYLMFRFGMHLGFRQRNLRELLLCPLGQRKKGELTLREMRCGEIRWSERDKGWEVFLPSLAFKNWDSHFFKHRAFRYILPDLEGLYRWMDVYINRHRSILLDGRKDPGTFFVRRMRSDRTAANMDDRAFYFAWRDTIQKYGIYNPFTRRGAIRGIMPHGPHVVRDVLATHVIKKTASYDLAAYAIQDTPEVVKSYYARFLPEEKTGMAALVLNKVWRRS